MTKYIINLIVHLVCFLRLFWVVWPCHEWSTMGRGQFWRFRLQWEWWELFYGFLVARGIPWSFDWGSKRVCRDWPKIPGGLRSRTVVFEVGSRTRDHLCLGLFLVCNLHVCMSGSLGGIFARLVQITSKVLVGMQRYWHWWCCLQLLACNSCFRICVGLSLNLFGSSTGSCMVGT